MTETGTAVQLRPSGRLAITDDQDFWTPEQAAALQVLGIKGATNGDLAVFFHYARRTRLDPFSRQIYFIKRREWVNGQWVDKWTIQVGIDGFRVMRDRVAADQGADVDFEPTVWYDGNGAEHNVWLSPEPPAACKVVMLKHTRDGRTLRYPAVLRTAAYMAVKDGKPTGQWKTQAEHMIEKCCEAFSTRRGFPQDFSGLYLEEEMSGRRGDDPALQAPHRSVTIGQVIPGRAEPAPEPEPPNPTGLATPANDDRPAGPPASAPAAERPATAPAAQVKKLADLIGSLPFENADAVLEMLRWQTGRDIDALAELTRSEVNQVTGMLRDHAEHAKGDAELAVTNLWAQYHAAKEAPDDAK